MCEKFSRIYSENERVCSFFNFPNCQITLQSDYIDNTSQKSTPPTFPVHCLHSLQLPHNFLLKPLLESQVSPTKLSYSPYCQSGSYESPKAGMARPEWGQGRNFVKQSRHLCIMGMWQRMGKILEPAYVNHLYWDKQCQVIYNCQVFPEHCGVAKAEYLLLPNGLGKGPGTIFQNNLW